MSIDVNHAVVMAVIVFIIGFVGVAINRQHLIKVMMSIELILLAVNILFITFAYEKGDLAGQVFVFFVLTVAAAEAAIGLAMLVVLFRERGIGIDTITELKQ